MTRVAGEQRTPKHRRRRPGRSVAVAVATLGLAALVSSGCGAEVVDSDSLSEQLQGALSRSLKVEVGEVDCPSGVRNDFAQSFSCSIDFPENGSSEVRVSVVPRTGGASAVRVRGFSSSAVDDD